ncbi:MAG TPA: hypothetical protein VF761_16995 [Gemmatimonadaceae bacterium]
MEVISRDAVAGLLEKWYHDPVAFCHDVFPREEWPRPQQCEILDAIWRNPATVVAAHRGWGKSRTEAFAALAFICTRANSLVFTIAPRWDQVTQGVWVDIRHLWAVSKLPKIFPSWRVLTHEIQTHPLTPKWRAVGVAASEVQNIEGKHPAAGRPALVLGDECKAIPDEFRESVKGMLKHPESRFVGIGTPGIPFGWFYEAFTTRRRGYKTFQFRGDTSPDPEVRAHVQKIGDDAGWDDPFFRQQWLAEFTGADEGVIIPLKIVTPAIRRRLEFSPVWRKVMSVDPAGKGSDHTVVTYRLGPVTIKQKAWQGWDIIKSEREVIALILEWKPERVIIDEGGLGEGVVSHVRDALKDTDIEIVGYRGGAKPHDKERYENRKAEDVHALRERYKEGAEFVEKVHAELRGRLLQLNPSPEAVTRTFDYLHRLTYGSFTPEQIAAVRPGSPEAAALADEIAAKLRKGPGISIPNEPNLIGQTCSWTADRSKANRTMVIDPDDSPDYADSDMMAYAADTFGSSLKGTTISVV